MCSEIDTHIHMDACINIHTVHERAYQHKLLYFTLIWIMFVCIHVHNYTKTCIHKPHKHRQLYYDDDDIFLYTHTHIRAYRHAYISKSAPAALRWFSGNSRHVWLFLQIQRGGPVDINTQSKHKYVYIACQQSIMCLYRISICQYTYLPMYTYQCNFMCI